MESCFCCPVCRGALYADAENGAYRCGNGHCFDISRHKTVNLLMSQVSGNKRRGDDKLMIGARRRFLDAGQYEPFARLIADTAVKFAPRGDILLADIGCGEGYYTAYIGRALADSCGAVGLSGIDISKQAVQYAAKRVSGEFAVASAFHLPYADESCDVMINIFAPHSPDELCRCVKPGGVVVRAFAGRNHLLGLKSAIYDEVRCEEIGDISLEGFDCVEKNELRYEITLQSSEAIADLFKMTPYYYKSGQISQKRAAELTVLKTPVHFIVAAFKKNR